MSPYPLSIIAAAATCFKQYNTRQRNSRANCVKQYNIHHRASPRIQQVSIIYILLGLACGRFYLVWWACFWLGGLGKSWKVRWKAKAEGEGVTGNWFLALLTPPFRAHQYGVRTFSSNKKDSLTESHHLICSDSVWTRSIPHPFH